MAAQGGAMWLAALVVVTSLVAQSTVAKPYESNLTTDFSCPSEYVVMECPEGQIEIVNAYFGNSEAAIFDSNGAQCDVTGPDCVESLSLMDVGRECNGRIQCSMQADINMFSSNDCPGNNKYLQVDWRCSSDAVAQNIACPSGYLAPSCLTGIIEVLNAAYATGDQYGTVDDAYGNQCSGIEGAYCAESSSEADVKTTCQGQQNCWLYAKDDAFSSTDCPASKYLAVEWRCVHELPTEQVDDELATEQLDDMLAEPVTTAAPVPVNVADFFDEAPGTFQKWGTEFGDIETTLEQCLESCYYGDKDDVSDWLCAAVDFDFRTKPYKQTRCWLHKVKKNPTPIEETSQPITHYTVYDK